MPTAFSRLFPFFVHSYATIVARGAQSVKNAGDKSGEAKDASDGENVSEDVGGGVKNADRSTYVWGKLKRSAGSGSNGTGDKFKNTGDRSDGAGDKFKKNVGVRSDAKNARHRSDGGDGSGGTGNKCKKNTRVVEEKM